MADIDDGDEFLVTWRRGEQVVGVVSMDYDKRAATVDVTVDGRYVATIDVR